MRNINEFRDNPGLRATWVQDELLELQFVTGTDHEQDNSGHSHSTPRGSSDGQNDRGRKRSTTRETESLHKAGKNDGGDGGDDQRDDRPDDNHPGGYKKQKRSKSQRRMACPYFKHDPVKYNRRSCCGPGFLGLHRIKEHVYRIHSTPHDCCPRCRLTFGTGAQLNDHMRSETPCDIVPNTTEEEGCTAEQQRLLRARTNTTTLTEEERWRTMYTILFPNATTVPTPYYDVGPAQEKSHALEVEKYADHLRRELPSQLRQELEDQVQKEFGVIEEVLRDQLANIVRNVCQRMLETWRDSITKPAPADSTKVTSGIESSWEPTLGRQFDTVSRSVRNEPSLSSAASSNICVEQEGAIPPDKSQIMQIEGRNYIFDGSDGCYKLVGFDGFDNGLNDELGSLLEQEPDYNLGLQSDRYCFAGPDSRDPVYGSSIGLFDHGSLTWDTVGRRTSTSTTQDNSSEQKAI